MRAVHDSKELAQSEQPKSVAHIKVHLNFSFKIAGFQGSFLMRKG
jgi:hypothetical protein